MSQGRPPATVLVEPEPGRARTFVATVRDGRGDSRHRATLAARDAARFADLGADPAAGVKAAMLFLIDREPKQAILAAFDIDVIRRYFPEFDDAFPAYLARL